jgi:hypothetical protein
VKLLQLSVFDRTIGLQCEGAGVPELLLAAYGCLATPPGGTLDISYSLGQANAGAGFFVAKAGQERLLAQDVAEFLFLFEKDLTIELQLRRRDLFFIHAAAVEYGGKAAIIAAPSGTGKSTTTWGLLHEGFRYLSDELAPVDLEGMAVYPYPHALCLKSDPPSPYTLPAATLRTTETLHIPVKFLPAEAVMKPTPLAALFFLNRDASGKGCQVREISMGKAAARLLANALNPLAHHGDGLDAAIYIAQQAHCYELQVSDLTQVSSVIRKAMA